MDAREEARWPGAARSPSSDRLSQAQTPRPVFARVTRVVKCAPSGRAGPSWSRSDQPWRRSFPTWFLYPKTGTARSIRRRSVGGGGRPRSLHSPARAPDLLGRAPAPTTLDGRDDLNSIGRAGHRHGCKPHTSQVGDRVRSVRGQSQPASQAFELNAMCHIIIKGIFHSTHILADGREKLWLSVEKTQPDEKMIAGYVENSVTLVTALSPVIGYRRRLSSPRRRVGTGPRSRGCAAVGRRR